MELVLFAAVIVVLMKLISPRVFLQADRLVARRHVRGFGNRTVTVETPRSIAPVRQVRATSPIDSPTDFSHLIDSIARAVRSHSPARDALISMLSTMRDTSAVSDLREWLLQGKDIHTGLQHCGPNSNEARLFSVLHHSLVDGVFIPSALEQSAIILREESHHHREVATASAQARSSARILTLLPFAVLSLLFLTSDSMRRELKTPSVLILLVIGIVINRLGWHWVQYLVKRSALPSTGIASQLVEQIVISLRAGISMRQAIQKWAMHSDALLFHSLSIGQPLSDALHEFSLRNDSDAQLLAQILIDAERDGLPVVETIHRLSSELRSRRRQVSEERLRQLPTKLVIPVVFCILPSFIFLSVMPLVISNLQHFQFSPPPTSTTS